MVGDACNTTDRLFPYALRLLKARSPRVPWDLGQAPHFGSVLALPVVSMSAVGIDGRTSPLAGYSCYGESSETGGDIAVAAPAELIYNRRDTEVMRPTSS